MPFGSSRPIDYSSLRYLMISWMETPVFTFLFCFSTTLTEARREKGVMHLAECGDFLFAWNQAAQELVAIALGRREEQRKSTSSGSSATERLADRVAKVAQVDSLPGRTVPLPWQVTQNHGHGNDDQHMSTALCSTRRRTGDGEILIVCFVLHSENQTRLASLDPTTFTWSSNLMSSSYPHDDQSSSFLLLSVVCNDPSICLVSEGQHHHRVILSGLDNRSPSAQINFWTVWKTSDSSCESRDAHHPREAVLESSIELEALMTLMGKGRSEPPRVRTTSSRRVHIQLMAVGPSELVAVLDYHTCVVLRLGAATRRDHHDEVRGSHHHVGFVRLATDVPFAFGAASSQCFLQVDDSLSSGSFSGRLLCLAEVPPPKPSIIQKGLFCHNQSMRTAAASLPSFLVMATSDLCKSAPVQMVLACGGSETVPMHHISRCAEDVFGLDRQENLIGFSTQGNSLTQLYQIKRGDGTASRLLLRSCRLPFPGAVPFRDRPHCEFSEVVVDVRARAQQGVHDKTRCKSSPSRKRKMVLGAEPTEVCAADYLAKTVNVYSRCSSAAPSRGPLSSPIDGFASGKNDGSSGSWMGSISKPTTHHAPPDWALHRGSIVTQFAARPVSAPPPASSAARRKLIVALLQDQWIVTKTKNHLTDVEYAAVLDASPEALGNPKHSKSSPHNSGSTMAHRLVGSAPQQQHRIGQRHASVHSSPTRAPLTGSNPIGNDGRRLSVGGPAVIAVPTSRDDVPSSSSLRTIVYYPAAVSRQRHDALDSYEHMLQEALTSLGAE